MNQPAPNKPDGCAYLFTFPFWVFVDRTVGFGTGTATTGQNGLRFYPLFRSGPANFSPMPAIARGAVPFEPGAKPAQPLAIFHIAILPLLKADGGPGMRAEWSEKWIDPPNMFPMDSLRLDVIGPAHEKFSPGALVRRLLEHLRLRTRQWWILRSAEGLVGYERCRFGIAANGAPVGGNPENLSGVRIPFGFEVGLTNESWMASIEDAVREVPVPLYEMSLLDAFHATAIKDLRSAVIHAANALEQGVDVRCSSLWPGKFGKKFREGFLTGKNATVHISNEMLRYFGRSFKEDCPGPFHELEKLWSARNSVAHGGSAEFRDGTQRRIVDASGAETMVRAVRTCLKWL